MRPFALGDAAFLLDALADLHFDKIRTTRVKLSVDELDFCRVRRRPHS